MKIIHYKVIYINIYINYIYLYYDFYLTDIFFIFGWTIPFRTEFTWDLQAQKSSNKMTEFKVLLLVCWIKPTPLA